jgi:hypothetical protein
MKFVLIWSYPPENRKAVLARFKDTGGMPPAGVKMLGRWHAIAGGKGVCVSESEDPIALGKWALEWSDLMSMEMYPAADDEQAAKYLA